MKLQKWLSNGQPLSNFSKTICVSLKMLVLRISSHSILSPFLPWLQLPSTSSEFLILHLFLVPFDPVAYWVIIIFLAPQWPSCLLGHNNNKHFCSTHSVTGTILSTFMNQLIQSLQQPFKEGAIIVDHPPGCLPDTSNSACPQMMSQSLP